jgi:hypothetical protein
MKRTNVMSWKREEGRRSQSLRTRASDGDASLDDLRGGNFFFFLPSLKFLLPMVLPSDKCLDQAKRQINLPIHAIVMIRKSDTDEAFAHRVSTLFGVGAPSLLLSDADLQAWPRGTYLLCCIERLDRHTGQELAPHIARIRRAAGPLGIMLRWWVGIEDECDAFEAADLHLLSYGTMCVCVPMSWEAKKLHMEAKLAKLCKSVHAKLDRILAVEGQGHKRASVDPVEAEEDDARLRVDWRQLPTDLLGHLFRFLDRSTQVMASRTCAQWNASVARCDVLHRNVESDVVLCDRHTWYRTLKSSWCASIRSVNSRTFAVNEDAFVCLGVLTRLRTLTVQLDSQKLPIDALVRMFDAPFVAKLTSFTVERYGPHSQPTSTWQNFLVGVLSTRMPALTDLSLYITNEPGEVDLAPLAQLPRVRRLLCDVRGFTQSPRQVRAFMEMPQLTSLHGYDEWNANTWHVLTQAPRHQLRDIDMARAPITSASLARIYQLFALETLSIQLASVSIPCPSVGALKALHTLHLESRRDLVLASYIVPYLAPCAMLREMSITGLVFSATEFHQLLRQHPLLNTLFIQDDCNHPWRTIAAPDRRPTLSPSLTSLTLYKCGALNIDEVVQHLPAMLPALTHFSTSGTFTEFDSAVVRARFTQPASRWPSLSY